MNNIEHRIKSVSHDSIGEELGIEEGDVLLSINGQVIEDVFDYRYLIEDDAIVMLIRKQDGEEWELEIEKDYSEFIGLEFENGLMSDYKSCTNDCLFCFVDQMPQGMRDTLYFKDDDYRLSFLQGNYITLTNLKAKDVERIIRYRLEPLNISIHTMNHELRCEMLKNRFAGESLKILDQLKDAQLEMNAQIVLCKDYNDKEELAYSIEALEQYVPYMRSLTIVPVGLSKFRDELTQFEPFTKEDAINVVEMVEGYQNKIFKKHGLHFLYASDEWYSMAEQSVPEAKRYDGFEQLENGVGMLSLLYEEVREAIALIDPLDVRINNQRTLSIATGDMAHHYIKELTEMITKEFPGIKVNVLKIMNEYFGESVTVAGLITGIDLVQQIDKEMLGEKLIIPISMLRSGEKVFLDNKTVDELIEALNIKVDICEANGQSMVKHILYKDEDEKIRNNDTIGYIDVYDTYNN